ADAPTCSIELTRIAIQAAGVQAAAPTTVSQVVNENTSGNIQQNAVTGRLSVVVPSEVAREKQVVVYGYTGAHVNSSENWTFTPGTSSGRYTAIAVDPCQDVTYLMINNYTSMIGLQRNEADPPAPMDKEVGVQGFGIVYDHYTRTIFTTQNEAADHGIDAWSIIGSAEAPDIKQRIVGWTRPAIRPAFIAAAMPAQISCD